jgi:aminotransferase
MSLSARTDHITQAEIRVMTIECKKIGGVNLAQSVCDRGVPGEVVEGTVDAIARGYNSYTGYDGLPEMRQAIAGKLRRFNGIEVDRETKVAVSAGSTGAFHCACLALLNPRR